MTEPRVCARYFGSDGTICATHSGKFLAPTETRCDLSLVTKATDLFAASHALMDQVTIPRAEYEQLRLAAAGVHLGDEGLDVERLAEAIFNVTTTMGHEDHPTGECDTCDWYRRLANERADDAAAEYARLTEGDSR